ncbi:MAG: BolA/IbaG family iron-sulfur metabolism protein [Polyangiaceae bacterium]|jgi:stress-induced morphogen|nr:BolA/IbaG family iron-sulfur metabolism protein [Polyangiaceae bacterium]
MGSHPTDFVGSVEDAIKAAIAQNLEGAVVDVASGSQGHYTISVVSPAFAGKSMLASQRLVLSAIAHLMKGDRAPVHAVDTLKTKAP